MRIYTPEECEQWVGYVSTYEHPLKVYKFKIDELNGQKLYMDDELADVARKCYTHDISRMEVAIHKLEISYPPFSKLIDKLNIFMSPKPSLSISNACCYGDRSSIIMWARTTQIPHVMTDYIIIHEIGHMVQSQFAPDAGKKEKVDIFREYLALRNAPKGIYQVYKGYDEENNKSIYEDEEDYEVLHKRYGVIDWDMNPVEWWAEDFRYLFGVDVEPYWGMSIDPPGDEIREFMLGLGENYGLG